MIFTWFFCASICRLTFFPFIFTPNEKEKKTRAKSILTTYLFPNKSIFRIYLRRVFLLWRFFFYFSSLLLRILLLRLLIYCNFVDMGFDICHQQRLQLQFVEAYAARFSFASHLSLAPAVAALLRLFDRNTKHKTHIINISFWMWPLFCRYTIHFTLCTIKGDMCEVSLYAPHVVLVHMPLLHRSSLDAPYV